MTLVKNWRTRIEIRDKENNIIRSKPIEILSGIFQGDGMSVLLFTICVNIVSWYQSGMKGIELNDKIKLTHILFIDDNKQFSKKENHFNEVTKTEEAFKDIGLLYNG